MRPRTRVRRRLLHWRPRWRGARLDGGGPDLDVPSGGGGGWSFLDFLDDLFAAVLVAVAVVLFVMTVVPAIVFVVELLLVGLIAVAGIVGRSLLGRPWTVEAVDTGTGAAVGVWHVRGFRRAGAVARALQERADQGVPLPTTAEVEAFVDEPDTARWPTP